MINRVKKENARHNIYLKNVVDHVGIGLISFNEDMEIDLFNKAAQKLLHTSRLDNISSLDNVYQGFSDAIKNLNPGKPRLIKIEVHKNVLQLSLNLNVFKAEGKTINLVTLHNIVNELERNELESWQKLIRVLTHEIMNSISPITSLSTTIARYFKDPDDARPVSIEKIDNEKIKKTLKGLNTIEKTGKNLIDFVTKYRSLSALPLPELKRFPVSSLFNRVILLMNQRVQSEKIEIVTDIRPASLVLLADENQIEQVLLNLVKNSIEALQKKENGKIILKSYVNLDERVIIEIIDNGTGIPTENISDIFIPFYSTKDDGSGIGLSLSRQIMNLHKGTITMISVPGEGTSFSLIF